MGSGEPSIVTGPRLVTACPRGAKEVFAEHETVVLNVMDHGRGALRSNDHVVRGAGRARISGLASRARCARLGLQPPGLRGGGLPAGCRRVGPWWARRLSPASALGAPQQVYGYMVSVHALYMIVAAGLVLVLSAVVAMVLIPRKASPVEAPAPASPAPS